MSSKQTLRKLVRSIAKGDAGNADSLFKKAIFEKVRVKLEALKKEVAQKMFKN